MTDPVQASDLKAAPVRWTWRDVFAAGVLSVVAGVPGSAKTLFGLYVAAEISQTQTVIVANAEDLFEESLVPRLVAAGANLENVILWNPNLASVADVSELTWHLEKLEVGLLVLDPLSAHATATRTGLLPLVQVARETGCAVVGLHHTTKTQGFGGATALDRIAGPTGGAAGTPRAVYAFGRHPQLPELERVLAPVKVNVGAEPASLSFAFELKRVRHGRYRGMAPLLRLVDETCPLTADDVVRGPEDAKPAGPQIAIAAEWLTRRLRNGVSLRIDKALAEAHTAGFRVAVVREAATQLGIRGQQRWKLPAAHPLSRPE